MIQSEEETERAGCVMPKKMYVSMYMRDVDIDICW